MTIEYVNSIQLVRFIELITAKRYATKIFQDSMVEFIKEEIDSDSKKIDLSDILYLSSLKNFLQEELNNITYFNTACHSVDNIGFPIKYNKIALQIQMALAWVEERQDNILSDLSKGILYHGLKNEYSYTLPELASDNHTNFWGNENSSVSSVLLWSVRSTLNNTNPIMIDKSNFPQFYPFYNEEFSINTCDSAFLNPKGMYLFGDYQFGGHRYFRQQILTYPEDCSSAVAKACGISQEQIKDISTTSLKEYYQGNNNAMGYKFTKITSSDHETLNFDYLTTGDVCVFGGHVLTVGKKDSGNITSIEFTRDIDTEGRKQLGGGVKDYTLELFENLAQHGKYLYVLRPNSEPIKESCSVIDLIARIETWLSTYRLYLNDLPYFENGSLLCDSIIGDNSDTEADL